MCKRTTKIYQFPTNDKNVTYIRHVYEDEKGESYGSSKVGA